MMLRNERGERILMRMPVKGDMALTLSKRHSDEHELPIHHHHHHHVHRKLLALAGLALICHHLKD